MKQIGNTPLMLAKSMKYNEAVSILTNGVSDSKSAGTNNRYIIAIYAHTICAHSICTFTMYNNYIADF